jgi:hypothetical protein
MYAVPEFSSNRLGGDERRMSEEQVGGEQNKEAAKDKQRQPLRHEDNVKIVSALNAPKRPIRRERDERQASERGSNLREWLGVGGLYLAAFVGIWAILRASADSGGQRDVMQGQLNEMQAEQRAWAYAELEPVGVIQKARDSYVIPLKYVIKNTGHLPAFGVMPMAVANLIVVKLGTIKSFVPNQKCAQFRKTPLNSSAGQTVFPGQEVIHTATTEADYPKISLAEWQNRPGEKAVILTGCIDYQIPGSASHHQTKFAYMVGTPIEENGMAQVGPLPENPEGTKLRFAPVVVLESPQAD